MSSRHALIVGLFAASLIAASCSKAHKVPAVEGPVVESSVLNGPPTQAPNQALAAESTPLPDATTLLHAANLATSVTQGVLDQVRDRIEALTVDANRAVTAIEAKPPTQAQLIALNAVFSDTKRTLMTDATLAVIGLQLDPPARAAVAAFTKRRHDELMARLAAAGRRHRQPSKP